mgnify:CR=1 FL=1
MASIVLSALWRFITASVMNLHKALSTVGSMQAVPEKESLASAGMSGCCP